MNYWLIIAIIGLIVIIQLIYPSGLIDQRFYNYQDVYPFLSDISKHTDKILSELKEIKQWDKWVEKELWDKKGTNEWTIFPFYGFGIWKKDVNKKCPFIVSLLKGIKGLKTATFSRMSPGTELKVHQGWADISNYILRCHLGIVCEPGKSGVTVENETRYHEVGKWLVFDDSKHHTGFNRGQTDRIVLLIDIDRPSFIKKGVSTVQHTKELDAFISKLND